MSDRRKPMQDAPATKDLAQGQGDPRAQDARAHPRRILLAVAGLSPQILTETLYALAVAADPPWIPTEIRLITTSEGAERARLSLLSADPGWFHRLLKDYRLPAVPFGVEDIAVVTDAEDRPLPDIRDLGDNARVADQITETIRAITADPDCALHVSLAGGRKTMGYYAGYALSLFGRVQDRLSHVLVSEPFEQSWAFFYPTPYPRVIETRDGKLPDTQSARVTLAEVPFVRLRDGAVPERLLSGQASFGETIAAAQRALQPAELVINLAARRIQAAGETIDLPPAPLAFLALMARRRQKGLHPARWNTEGIAEQYLSEYRRIVGDHGAECERVEAALAKGMTKDDFDQRKARTNRELIRALGSQLAAPYLIQADGARPHTRYRLTLDSGAIRFADLGREEAVCAKAAPA
jgi:CRISPR-associated protein (TIGR02584 family)